MEKSDIKKVLIVDDMEVNTLLAETLLRSVLPDASVLIAHDGIEAVSAAKEYSPQLIFMDIQMPGMSGYEAASTIREAELQSSSPKAYIVALSADMGQNDMNVRMEAGFDFFISKPLKKSEVEKVIQIYTRTETTEDHDLSDIHISAPRFNLNSLKERLAGNNDIIEIVFESAKESMATNKSLLEDLRNGWSTTSNSERNELIQTVTHKLHGLSLTVGFDRLSEISKNLHNCPPELESKQLKLLDTLLGELNDLADLQIGTAV